MSIKSRIEQIHAMISKRPRFTTATDPKPMAIPVGFERPPSLQEQIKRLIHNEDFQRGLREAGQETFEEAEDFDVGDDYDPSSPWEEEFHGQFDEDARLESKFFEMKKGSKERTGRAPKVKEKRAKDDVVDVKPIFPDDKKKGTDTKD